MIDESGDDEFFSGAESQGYAGLLDKRFSEVEAPAGILLDFSGKDRYEMKGYPVVDSAGRLQNTRGIAIDRELRH